MVTWIFFVFSIQPKSNISAIKFNSVKIYDLPSICVQVSVCPGQQRAASVCILTSYSLLLQFFYQLVPWWHCKTSCTNHCSMYHNLNLIVIAKQVDSSQVKDGKQEKTTTNRQEIWAGGEGRRGQGAFKISNRKGNLTPGIIQILTGHLTGSGKK